MTIEFTSNFESKMYTDNGRILEYGKDISSKDMQLMRAGEIFTLINTNRCPISKVLMDSYNQIREKPICIDLLKAL